MKTARNLPEICPKSARYLRSSDSRLMSRYDFTLGDLKLPSESKVDTGSDSDSRDYSGESDDNNRSVIDESGNEGDSDDDVQDQLPSLDNPAPILGGRLERLKMVTVTHIATDIISITRFGKFLHAMDPHCVNVKSQI